MSKNSHDKKNAREYWIIEEKGFSTWVSDKPIHSADTTEEIHVREVVPGSVTITRTRALELAGEIGARYTKEIRHGLAVFIHEMFKESDEQT